MSRYAADQKQAFREEIWSRLQERRGAPSLPVTVGGRRREAIWPAQARAPESGARRVQAGGIT
jgi:hypothetical protein